ncbi:MAG: LysR family transcriptional regulator [Bdellovibrionales bacterium]
MKLSSSYLEAFYTIVQKGSFSKAAESLFVSQSALSQRLQKLEEELGVSLLIRNRTGVILTAKGQALLRHCQLKSQLENEFLESFYRDEEEVRGTITIGTYSSISRSAILPSLDNLIKKYNHATLRFLNYEPNQLLTKLKNGEIDIAIADYNFSSSGIVEKFLGKEEYVVISPVNRSPREAVFLDYSPTDTATFSFFDFQGMSDLKYSRNFMGDVYGIIDGVERGLGKAVMSKHLIKDSKKVQIEKKNKRYFRNIYLHHFEQTHYTELQKLVVAELSKNIKKFL